MDKEARCEKQQAPGHMEDDGDAVSCSTDTSRWSPPSSLSHSSESPQYSSDCEDKAGLLTNRTPHALPSVRWKGSKQSTERSREKDKKAREAHKQNQNHPMLKLPPIKPLQGLKPKLQPDSLISIRELKNQVWDVEQQLKEARTENKLLKRLQHRHTVALQYFQDSEDSISQILKRHNSEVRGLQRLLSEARNSRDNLARQLQATENRLLNTKASLQHLQLLSQNHSLLQREDLTLRLAEVTAQLEMKDKRILYLQKNFELCQASFKRQIVAEKREVAEERKLTSHLQEQIYQLNKISQDREKELEKHNIYSQRFLKGPFKKGWKNKMVQTDGLVFIPSDVGRLLEIEYSDTEKRLEQQESSVECMDSSSTGCSTPVQTESLVIENPERRVSAKVTEENHQKDTVVHAGPFFRCHATETPGKSRHVHFDDTREDSNGSEESPEHQNHGDCAKEKEASKAPQVFEEKQEARHESSVAYILEESLNSTKPERKHYKRPKIRRKYIFKQSTEDLHNGRPVSSGVDMTSYESTKSTEKVEILSSGIHDLHLSGEKSKTAGVDSSQWELTAAQQKAEEDSSSEVTELVTYSS